MCDQDVFGRPLRRLFKRLVSLHWRSCPLVNLLSFFISCVCFFTVNNLNLSSYTFCFYWHGIYLVCTHTQHTHTHAHTFKTNFVLFNHGFTLAFTLFITFVASAGNAQHHIVCPQRYVFILKSFFICFDLSLYFLSLLLSLSVSSRFSLSFLSYLTWKGLLWHYRRGSRLWEFFVWFSNVYISKWYFFAFFQVYMPRLFFFINKRHSPLHLLFVFPLVSSSPSLPQPSTFFVSTVLI